MDITGNFIYSHFLNVIDRILTNSIMERARPEKPIVLEQDSKDIKKLYFKNNYIEIQKNKITTKKYSELENYVFEDKIIDINFKYTEKKGTFERFFENATRKDKANYENSLNENDLKRKKSLMTLIGYLLHSYHDMKKFALVLIDGGTNEMSEMKGRTGKSLISKALTKVINATKDSSTMIEIDGKSFDDKNKHKYEECSRETELVCLNDIQKFFKLDLIFNSITDYIKVDQKRVTPFNIEAKMMITTNMTLLIDGASKRDRFKIFELSEYYNDKKSPSKEFNQWFFSSDWKASDWNEFYSFIIRSVQLYFKEGIIDAGLMSYAKNMLNMWTETLLYLWIDFWKK